MKRHGNLFHLVSTEDALYQGYMGAREKKRATYAVLQFERAIGANIRDLSESLQDGTYRPRKCNEFWVQEPKPRLIRAPAFRDRVVQHAVYRVIRPIFDATFIHDSHGCRIGRGTHSASDRLQAALQQAPRDSYSLQLDVRRFYYSIDHQVLDRLLQRKIKDKRLLTLLRLFYGDEAPGVPIGNLLSQLYALVYLNPLDHFIKRQLKVQHYIRYVDDMMLVGLTRDEALHHRAAVSDFMRDELSLELSRSSIAPVRRGANFVGYRTWGSRRFIRRHALRNSRKATAREDLPALVSMLGHARRTSSWLHISRHIRAHKPHLYCRLPASHWIAR